MRKPDKIIWTCFHHWINRKPAWDTSYPVGLSQLEGSWIKCTEWKPSDADVYDLDQFCVAPLSTVKESTLPPPPKTTDPDFRRTGDPNVFGNYCFSSGLNNITDILSADPSSITVTFSKMQEAENADTNTDVSGRISQNLSAHWFKLINYNDLSIAKVDDAFGFTSKFKCGLPITSQDKFEEEDIVRLNVSNVSEDGYIIFYVSDTPDENWGGNKTNYAIDKWKVTRNSTKTIDVTIDSKINGNVFVVWLPNNDCKLPSIDIYRIR